MIRHLFPLPDPNAPPRLVRVARVPPAGEKPAMREPGERQPWIVRPEGVRTLWWLFGAILVLNVVAELFVHLHPHFELEGAFAFHAWFGFLGCVAMVVFARLLAMFLKRKDTFYDVVD
ncbi:hypothetical protein F1188_01080 [Roseospira marina]|uniref:Uncharacterized protein n=1 Tax=Roseospira marina TaxID=140057 RepID=A0A5M6IHU9_9PROT|nr:hypothetical protein [Roseospira marina]KAA5607389.1 hypothetical protein F1188_01080 [Roseospira marina]MBB4312440.1 hypothetical protein [Roseospira marina]MBB5085544.1 hypothetical protein [Roseospira marina]